MNLSDYFINLAALVPLVVAITEFLKLKLKVENGLTKQLLSWGVGIVLCLVGMFLKLGMLADATLIKTILYGISVGFVSNGVFDIKIVQSLLDFIFKFLKNETPNRMESKK